MTNPHQIKPPTVLLMGAPGGGKTWSLATLAARGIDIFVIITEPNGLDTLLDAFKALRVPLDRLHYTLVSPAAPGWAALEDMANKASTMSYEAIAGIKAGVSKDQTRQFTALLKACNDFVDQHGESFGDVGEWDDSRALVIDSLSGVNQIIMAQTIGYKPSAHQGEWGVAMNMQLHFLTKLCFDLRCYFVVLAHLDKELNELTATSSITVKALGRKNAPEILKLFSEIPIAKRMGPDYVWSTEEVNYETKQRGLPLKARIPPDFGQIVDIHEARKKAAATAAPTSGEAAA